MKNVLIKIKQFLISQQPKTMAVKLACLGILFFLGCLWQPMLALTFVIGAVFIAFEQDVNSILYPLFFMPLISIFKFDNKYGLNYWFLLVCVFIAVLGIKTLIKIIKKQEKINIPLLIILGGIAIYLAIPFAGNFSFISLAESYVWLLFFYIIFANIKKISVKEQALIASAGFLFSAFIGCFVTIIPYLSENIYLYSGGALLRFSGAMNNPNTFYSWGEMCLALLIVLMANKKLSLWYSILAGVVFALCYMALSKTFMVVYIIMIAIMLIVMLIKKNPHKTRTVVLMLAITIITAGVLFRYTQSYYDRFFNSAEIAVETVSQVTPNVEGGMTATEVKSSVQNIVNTVTTGRLELWKAYLKDIHEHKTYLFGFGINTAHGILDSNSHNTYIQILYEVGIVGYLIIAAILIYYLKKTNFRVLKNIGSMSYLPAVVLACNYMTENLFLSQMGNMLFLFACFGVLVIEKDSFDNIDKREVVVRGAGQKSKNNNFTLAILTPAYNRPELLKNAYASLVNQTCQDFVWYIVDDGSTTPQALEVEKFKKENKVKIHLIVKENGGKHTALNRGLQEITEPAVLILDNDDTLLPNAVEQIKDDWSLIDKRVDICGLGYLKCHTDGRVVGKQYTIHGVVDSFVNERFNNNTWGDKEEVFKTEILKKYPFPEFTGERFVSESTVWAKISGDYKMVFFNDAIYSCEYLEDGLSSNVRKRLFNNPQGSTACYKELTTRQFNFTISVKFTLLYIVHSLASNNGIRRTIKNSYRKVLTTVLLPFGGALYLYRKRKFR